MNRVYVNGKKHLYHFFFVIQNLIDKVNNNAIIVAVRSGLALAIPFMIIGSFSLFITNVPISIYQQAMLSIFGEAWKNFGSYIWIATFGIVAITMNLSVSYAMTEARKDKSLDIPPMINALVSLACLFIITNVDGNVMDWLGSLGIFIAIISAIISSKIYIFAFQMRRFKRRLFSNVTEDHFNMAIFSIIPVACTMVVFGVIRVMMTTLGIDDIHSLIYGMKTSVFTNLHSSFSTGILFVVLLNVFWFFGLHGHHILRPVSEQVLIPATEMNASLALEGLPPTEILTMQFFDVIVHMGGAGATFSLVLALLISSKHSNNRKIANISILPGIIHVNEVIVYGLPLVLNFYFLIPFVLVPTLTTIVSYAALSLGLVPLSTVAVDWTTPIFISGYIITGGSIAGAVLQFVNLVIGIVIYLPFVRLYEKSLEQDTKKTLRNLMDDVLSLPEQRQTIILKSKSAEGNMARVLVNDLRKALKNDELMLYYQPLVMEDGSMFGVESLLRWNHKQLGFIPPPIIITIAEEAGMMNELGEWIFKSSVRALKEFRENGIDDIVVSINITPSQLDDPAFVDKVLSFVDEYKVDPRYIDVEITEQTALGGITRMEKIKTLKEHGFNIAMDDFGMGHGSLMYLKDMNLDVIKIDGSIIKEIETNQSCSDIIATIVRLCSSMDIHVIAEFVENENQRELLKDLGCFCYQGYLYSPALPFDQAGDYMLKKSG